METQKFRIRVRVRKKSSVFNQPFYDTYEYDAINRDEAMETMRRRIYEEHECFNPEIITVTKL
jgi:hypothetical protein